MFALAQAAYDRGELPTDHRNPKDYTLGTGHVRFFYPRLGYLEKRFKLLVSEMKERGFKPNHMHTPLVWLPPDWITDWEPDDKALRINRERIALRMPK